MRIARYILFLVAAVAAAKAAQLPTYGLAVYDDGSGLGPPVAFFANLGATLLAAVAGVCAFLAAILWLVDRRHRPAPAPGARRPAIRPPDWAGVLGLWLTRAAPFVVLAGLQRAVLRANTLAGLPG